MKPNYLTPRDLEVIANATQWQVRIGFGKATFLSKSRKVAEVMAEAWSSAQKRPALLYAIGVACGTEASALVAIYKNGQWCPIPQEQTK